MPKILMPPELEPLARRFDVDPNRLVYFTLPLDARETLAANAFNTIRVQALPFGTPRMVDDRKLKVAEEDLALVLGDLGTRKNEIAMLYEHGNGPRGGVAAGWMNKFEAQAIDGGGIFSYVGWTKTASQEIRAGEWKYLSPGFFGVYDDDGFVRPRVLFEVSLTNTPAIDGMLPVAASVMRGIVTHRADALPWSPDDRPAPEAATTEPPPPPASPGPASAEPPPMIPVTETKERETNMDMKKFAALLGLPPDATEEQILTAFAEKEKDKEKQLATLVADAVKAELATIREAAEAEAKIKAEADVKKAEVETLLLSAEKAGKITPATRDSARKLAEANPEAFKALMEKAPRIAPTAPVVDRTVRTDGPVSSRVEVLDLVTKHANRHGLTLRAAYSDLAARGVVN